MLDLGRSPLVNFLGSLCVTTLQHKPEFGGSTLVNFRGSLCVTTLEHIREGEMHFRGFETRLQLNRR